MESNEKKAYWAPKIEHVLVSRGMSKNELAKALGYKSPSGLYNKLNRDSFTTEELMRIAEVLNCTFEASFILNDSGEKF